MRNIDPNQTDNARTVMFFSDLLLRHQVSPQSLNWASRSSQERRFQVLADIGMKLGVSVLDVGCGLGDFYDWQRRVGLDLDYHGIDLTPAMIETALSRFPAVDFQIADAGDADLGVYDFVIASGLFYLRQHEPQWFLENTVERLFRRSRLGLAFNSLSAWSGHHNTNEFYADPVKTLEFCRTLSPRVTLRHDYHPRDFTIYLFQPEFQP